MYFNESGMKKFIEISEEVLLQMLQGKCVKGSIHMDELTGRVAFKAYHYQARKRDDRVIAHLEHGWIKESAQRYKFYNSVKKELGIPMTKVVMERELKTAVHELEIERIIDLM